MKGKLMAKTAVAAKKPTPVAVALDFAADAGVGMEGADRSSFAIPFLVVLQSNSPQLDTIPKAKAGLFLNSVTDRLYDAVNIVPVAFQRRYLAWLPRDMGGGFRGEYSVAQVESSDELHWKRDDKGQMVLPDSAILKDTRNHFVLVCEPDGSFTQALLSLSSTQIKKSKRWMTQMQSIQLRDARGAAYNPPSFSHIYRATTIAEENEKGKWKGIQINLVGPVTDPALYNAAKAFHALVVSGKVETAPPVADAGDDDERF
jgi:hypothetical protein